MAQRLGSWTAVNPRGGRASAGVLLALLLVAAGLLGVLLWPAGEGRGAPRAAGAAPQLAEPEGLAPVGPAADRAARSGAADAAGPSRLGPGADPQRSDAQPGPAPAPAPALGLDQAPSGRGSIRGRVLGPVGGRLPQGTEVLLAPSAHLIGSERAVRRRTEPDAEGRYRFEDLPLAGYEVRARYPAGGSGARAVLLRTPGAELVLDLELRPRAAVVGRVHGPDGLVVDAIEVTLERTSIERSARRGSGATSPKVGQTRTDAGGWFRFDDLEDGGYRVLVGNAAAPAIAPIEVEVDGAVVQLPNVVVPALGRIDLLVTDALGAPLAQIDVNGFGTRGGVVHGRTDDFGRLSATLLPPGYYRLRAADPLHGAGFTGVELGADVGPVAATLVLRR